MVAFTFTQRLTPTLALMAAGVAGVLIALAMLFLPDSVIEGAVLASGIPAFVPAAEPPLGMTARVCLAAFAGGVVAAIGWLALNVLMGMVQARGKTGEARRPTVRRADAHPDAPPREPFRAGRDLELELSSRDLVDPVDVPFELADLEIPPEPVIAMGIPSAVSFEDTSPPSIPPPVQPMPYDLDQPLAAYDPGALRDVPLAPPPPVAPLRRQPQPAVYEQGERFETFDLAPPRETKKANDTSVPIAAPETAATVHALLDRLERGIARREDRPRQSPVPTPVPVHRLNDTLADLRKLAVGA